ncbi:class I SAM-dependent methyltransferase [Niallia taxi]|uniref:Class I SAM-dependent methyltransferase n=1 Tax=Niallia taxi TaxID=2499688 RepID=A0A437KB64_9BACI|nr:methyltransferase domain-containing protein [Niallia taxi]RVT62684.1 class I SAM-dependent methyltransferase [Niallia taxi]
MKDHNSDEIKSKVQQQFGANAKKYVESKSHSSGEDLKMLLEWSEPKKSWTVLDIATGGGHVTKLFAPHVNQVIATDITREMLKEAKRFVDLSASNVNYIVADAESLPFLDNTFDLVTCRIAAHHFPNAKEFIKEAHRVLKQGGRLLLVDNIAPVNPLLDNFINTLEQLRDNSHVRCYSQNEWQSWVDETGFVLVKSKVRKKQLEYQSWVERTTSSDEEISKVAQYIQNAEKQVKDYFDFQLTPNAIHSFKLDEWIALMEKK